jgi:hypothetical protein
MRDGLVRAEFRQQVQESSVEKLYYVGDEIATVHSAADRL